MLIGSGRLFNLPKATQLIRMQTQGLTPELLGSITEPLQISGF